MSLTSPRIHEQEFGKDSALRLEDIAEEENKILNELEQIVDNIEMDPPTVDNYAFADDDANYNNNINNNYIAESLPNTQIATFNQTEEAQALNFINIQNNMLNIGFGLSIDSLMPE